jgi:hypothetical protein
MLLVIKGIPGQLSKIGRAVTYIPIILYNAFDRTSHAVLQKPIWANQKDRPGTKA